MPTEVPQGAKTRLARKVYVQVERPASHEGKQRLVLVAGGSGTDERKLVVAVTPECCAVRQASDELIIAAGYRGDPGCAPGRRPRASRENAGR